VRVVDHNTSRVAADGREEKKGESLSRRRSSQHAVVFVAKTDERDE
jgi:hypothetical protein